MNTAITCTPPLMLPAPNDRPRAVADYDRGYSDGYWRRPLSHIARSLEYVDGYYDGMSDTHDEPEFEDSEIPF